MAAERIYDDLDRLGELVLAIPADPAAGIPGELKRFMEQGEAFFDGKQFPDALVRFRATRSGRPRQRRSCGGAGIMWPWALALSR
jgi:hypothetical protein